MIQYELLNECLLAQLVRVVERKELEEMKFSMLKFLKTSLKNITEYVCEEQNVKDAIGQGLRICYKDGKPVGKVNLDSCKFVFIARWSEVNYHKDGYDYYSLVILKTSNDSYIKTENCFNYWKLLDQVEVFEQIHKIRTKYKHAIELDNYIDDIDNLKNI